MSQQGPYKALDNIAAIRKRPGQFIGDIATPDHLVTEILDNALDEVANGHASVGTITFQDGACWITDNGRGLAVYPMELPDGTFKDSIETLCTDLHSGAKFDNVDYSTLIGMHGVGLVVTNALCEWMIIRTRDRNDRNNIHKYTFVNSELTAKEIEQEPDNGNWSTQVGFKPSGLYFESVEFNTRAVGERLILAQAKHLHSRFSINGKELPQMGYEQLVRTHYLNLKDTDALFNLKHEPKINQKISVYITYTPNDQNTIIKGDVNLRLCDGRFMTTFQTALKKTIISKLDKKRFNDVPDNLLTLGLKLCMTLTVPEPRFDSQTKTRMTLPVKNELIDPLQSQIEWFLDREGIMDIIQHNIEQRLKKSIVKVKHSKNNRVSAGNKLKDCLKMPGKIIYVLEGESALGTLKQVRCTKTEAIFPLRGKVLNVESNTLDKIKDNKEIKDFLEAIGPKSNRRYEKIKIVADADPDGWHIAVLFILIIQKFAPDYIQSGNASLVLPPLFGVTKGKKYVPVYDASQIDSYRAQGFTVQRFKGLGEMNPKKLEISLRSGHEYVLQWPEDDDQLANLIGVITDKEIKRALMRDDRCRFNRILQEVAALASN